MSLFIFLTVVQAIVAALLVAVILMQKSEGGGLGVGGSPAGLMSARGAADFLSHERGVCAKVMFRIVAVLYSRFYNFRNRCHMPHVFSPKGRNFPETIFLRGNVVFLEIQISRQWQMAPSRAFPAI